MRLLLLIFLLVTFNNSFSQKEITAHLLDSISLGADDFFGVDDFENYYYAKGNTLYKKTPKKTYSYTNTQLGNINSIDITNPLKILVFYRDFNTIIFLDNRLNELSDRINLNDESYGKNAMFATVSSNNNLWLYSLDDNLLTLWNYETKRAIFDSQPLQFYQKDFEALRQVSTYEYCWLMSNSSIIQFNEYGSFMKATTYSDVSAIHPFNNDLVYIKKGEIYFQNNDLDLKINGVKSVHLSTNYFVNKNRIYFYSSNQLYRYDILKN